MELFNPRALARTRFLFFTGKGGVGKTSLSCATAVALADTGKKVLLISTDPASNLQDVFGCALDGDGTFIPEVPGMCVVNIDPEAEAAKYREQVVGPYRGLLPDDVVRNMEEQLSGSCTVEIAAFNAFSDFLADPEKIGAYEFVIFDTAPTGHTLRMLQLPSAWTSFIQKSTHGASCLGQLSGLAARKEIYREALENLSDATKTTLFLVARPDEPSLREAARTAHELDLLSINNQTLLLNGVLIEDSTDKLAVQMKEGQQKAIGNMPNDLQPKPTFMVPLRSYNMDRIGSIRALLSESKNNDLPESETKNIADAHSSLNDLVKELYRKGTKVIFTMGKGGVGKTTVATHIAIGLAAKGSRVLLATTDPANHLNGNYAERYGITTCAIDEHEALERYKDEVRQKAKDAQLSRDDLDYIEEDLNSPCTQEIAVFKTFAEIVARSEEQVVVIDTAPTGHTLLLLDATESYHKEVERTHGSVSPEVANLLPRLRNEAETEVVIVTLPEATPVYEAERLQADLKRAGICNRWWVVNACLSLKQTADAFLKARSSTELKWIGRVDVLSEGHTVLIPWQTTEELNE